MEKLQPKGRQSITVYTQYLIFTLHGLLDSHCLIDKLCENPTDDRQVIDEY